MRKLLSILVLSAIFTITLSARTYSWTGMKKPVDGDSVGTTSADTVIINLDNTYRNYFVNSYSSFEKGNLKVWGKVMYKAVSSAGTPALNIVMDFSPDSTNWVEAFTYEDSIKTETWVTDTLPTAIQFYKYARIIGTGVSSSNNADTAWWFWFIFRKR